MKTIFIVCVLFFTSCSSQELAERENESDCKSKCFRDKCDAIITDGLHGYAGGLECLCYCKYQEDK